jgi:hypothetical protein
VIPPPDPSTPVYVPLPLSQWLTPSALVGLAAFFVTCMSGLAAALVRVIRELKSNRREGREAGAYRDRAIGDIKVLVDGRYNKVLEELAALRTLVANKSGLASDRTLANDAHARVDSHTKETSSP